MNDMNKKLLRNLIIILGVFILLFIVLFIYQKINGRNVDYEKIEDRMVEATKEYVSKLNLYPTNDSDVITVSSETLINGEYMEPFEKQTNDTECNGRVIVQNNNNYYDYMPYLECKGYHTTTIASKIIDTKVEDNTTDGLYLMNDEYVFMGEVVNNNLSFAGTNWRIIKVTNDGYLKLIRENVSSEDVVWDNRYNADINEYSGYNNLDVSRMKETLGRVYNSFNDSEKTNLVSYDVCVGSRTVGNLDFNTDEECQVVEKLNISLPNMIDSMRASRDSHCEKSNIVACGNYNYFTKFFKDSWSITPVKGNTYQVYIVNNYASKRKEASDEYDIYAVIYLNGKNIYLEGNGSVSNPYKIK